MTNYNLFKVLKNYGIPSVAQEPDWMASGVSLKELILSEIPSSPVLAVKEITMNWQKEDKVSGNLKAKIEDALRLRLNTLLSRLGNTYKDLHPDSEVLFSSGNNEAAYVSFNFDPDNKKATAAVYLGTGVGIVARPEISLTQSASSAVQAAPEETGGIDFRALPMTIQPMGSFSGLNFKLPQLSQAQLKQVNIESEIQQVKNLIKSGAIPSGDRIKELIAACVQKGKIDSQVDNLLLCLADICKLEEQNAYESSPELREALVIVDSFGNFS
ncbi:MAG: hypothetical protein NTY47_08905 [Candidatus Omnitrophica bacterium]|nr:hypothetical protein [Candidatus Omnitrophota bacterium]